VERDFKQQMLDDLPEQYKQHRIEVFQKAMAEELEKVYKFFFNLITLRSLRVAEGVQLDGIGDIVCLSRSEAYTLADLASIEVPMDDETYRSYLLWKINQNTTNCTHNDVYSALKMFWTDIPIYYSESLEYPATAIYTLSRPLTDEEQAVYKIARLVKAAGVSLVFNELQAEDGVTYAAGSESDRVVEQIVEGA